MMNAYSGILITKSPTESDDEWSELLNKPKRLKTCFRTTASSILY